MQDLISRHAALYAIYGICNEPVAWLIRAAREIEKLPSVQPEPSEITDEQAILHLQSTGWMQNHDREMYESGLREQLADDSGAYDSLVSCEDAISRQAAIDAHCELCEDRGRCNCDICPDIEVFQLLPSAQPEERTEKRTDAFALPEIIVLNEYDTIESEDGRTGFGVYVPEEKKIYVAGDVPQEMKLKALFHELAHWVQDVSGIDFDEDTANELSEIIYDAVVPEETHDKRTETPACDLISCKEAIKAFKPYAEYDSNMTNKEWVRRIESVLTNLPKAQPEIIKCKDCKYSDENWRRVSVRWLPCMDIRVPSNWFCGSAERRKE